MGPSKENGQLMLERPKLPDFREQCLKPVLGRMSSVCDQVSYILLIGLWRGNRVMPLESPSSTFWFQPVWGLRAGGQHAVNFFYLVGF